VDNGKLLTPVRSSGEGQLVKKILAAVIGLVLLLALMGACHDSEFAEPGSTHSAAHKTAKQKAAAAKAKKAAAKKAAAKKAAAEKAESNEATAEKAESKEAAQERADEKNTFDNCADMHNTYPHGVGLSGARDHTRGARVTNFKISEHIYWLNFDNDRDYDGIACEKL
jgi:hypothetical protein